MAKCQVCDGISTGPLIPFDTAPIRHICLDCVWKIQKAEANFYNEYPVWDMRKKFKKLEKQIKALEKFVERVKKSGEIIQLVKS